MYCQGKPTPKSRLQVVTGGHYDVDVVLTDPTRNVLYKQIKKQYDSHTWTAAKTGILLLLVNNKFLMLSTGEYIACFSNEFSTFSHKLVYIDFQVVRNTHTWNRIFIFVTKGWG